MKKNSDLLRMDFFYQMAFPLGPKKSIMTQTLRAFLFGFLK
jgi:hypothetical protein